MNGAAIKELADRIAQPQQIGNWIVTPEGWTANDPAALIKPGPLAQALPVSTLGAVRDYVKANKDHFDPDSIVVHIVGPTAVSVLGPLSARARVRETFLTAKCADLSADFLGKFMPIEEFLIGLQVRFADGEDRGRVLALLSNVKHETVKTAMDDGITQVVQARAGVALVSDVAVPNPVRLTPFRTFRDVSQVISLFVLRVKAGHGGGLPDVGLFEADGGAWRLMATDRILSWFEGELPGVSTLA